MAKLRVIEGRIASGFQFASGAAVGRAELPSPFSAATLSLQQPHFAVRGIDLEALVPGLHWGTINLVLAEQLALSRPDFTAEAVDWTSNEPAIEARVAPETFSFIHCCLCYRDRFHAGLVYYPHPETKPTTNPHRHDVIEVLSHRVPDLAEGEPAALILRSDAFVSGGGRRSHIG